MTFSTIIKNELSKLEYTKLEAISELSAIVRNSSDIYPYIKVITENNAIARRIYKMFKGLYDITPIITVRQRYSFNKGINYILEIKKKTKEILKDLSIIDVNNNLCIPKTYIVNDEELLRAYLRGLFIVCGSINDPKTSRYHLEFIISDKEYANYISNLLNSFKLNSKVIKREKKYMVYIKEAEKISDYLRIIKAYNAVMYFEDIRIYRDHVNMTNRLNNCEQANIDKIFLTSSRQIKDIEKLEKYDIIDLLDDKLKEVIKYRLKYREVSLQELSDIMTRETGVKITKSGLNHRFRKIREIITNIENK